MNIYSRLKIAFWNLRRRFKLIPIFSVLREIEKHKLDLGALHALDMFGGKGDMITIDYAPYVKSLEIWEIDQRCEDYLRSRFPNAVIKIVDSYQELKKTSEKFDFILADAWPRLFDSHCEHFDSFPDILKILNATSVLVLNVMPEIKKKRSKAEHLKCREAFYQVNDSTKISLDQMVKIYRNIVVRSGFDIHWWFLKDRYFMYPLRRWFMAKRLCYLVLGLQKARALPVTLPS